MRTDKKYLIIGANGLIGRSVARQLNGIYNWQGTYYNRKELGLLPLDIAKKSDVSRTFETTRPNYVIHCANLARGVDFCEKNPGLARSFHLDATIYLGEQCQKYGAKLIFISSDYVFDGKKKEYYEDDPVCPLNIYGELKLKSEIWIMKNLQDYVIARTTNVYGWDPLTKTPNYLMSVYFNIMKGKVFKAPIFLWGRPTYVKDLASAIIELSCSEAVGLFHIVGASFVNRLQWAKKICQLAGWSQKLVIPQKVVPKNMIPRPLKSNMNTDKFSKQFKTNLRGLDEGLKAFLCDMEEEPIEKIN